MWLKALMLSALIYVPFLGQSLGVLPQNITTFFFCLVIVSLYLAFSGRDDSQNYLWRNVKPFAFYVTFIIALALLHLILYKSTFREFLRLIQGYLLPLFIITFFTKGDYQFNIKVMERFFVIVGILFLFQLTLSIYESNSGSYIFMDVTDPDENQVMSLEDLAESRIILNMVTSQIPFGEHFKVPLSGMMGQWNYWGTQLPFYNLIFLLMWYMKKHKYFLILIFLTLIASIYNTSRFGIISICATDILFISWFYPRYRKYMMMIIGILSLLLIYKLAKFLYVFDIYFSKANTLALRLENYQIYLFYLSRIDFFDLLTGLGASKAKDISFEMTGYGSFENEMFSLLYYLGVAGFLAFCYFIFKQVTESLRFSGQTRYIGLLIVMNILGVSIISNLAFSYLISPFIVLIYIYNIMYYLAKDAETIEATKEINYENHLPAAAVGPSEPMAT